MLSAVGRKARQRTLHYTLDIYYTTSLYVFYIYVLNIIIYLFMHIYYNFIALLESLRGVTSNDSVLNIFRLKD